MTIIQHEHVHVHEQEHEHEHRHLTQEQVSTLRHALNESSGEPSTPILCRYIETTPEDAQVEEDYEQTVLYKTETDMFQALMGTDWFEDEGMYIPWILDILTEPDYKKNRNQVFAKNRENLLSKIGSVIDKRGLPEVIAVVQMWLETDQMADEANESLEDDDDE